MEQTRLMLLNNQLPNSNNNNNNNKHNINYINNNNNYNIKDVYENNVNSKDFMSDIFDDDVGQGWVQEIPWSNSRRPVFVNKKNLKSPQRSFEIFEDKPNKKEDRDEYSQIPVMLNDNHLHVPPEKYNGIVDYYPMPQQQQIIDIRPHVPASNQASAAKLNALAMLNSINSHVGPHSSGVSIIIMIMFPFLVHYIRIYSMF